MPILQPARRNGKQYVNPIPTTVGGFSIMLKVLPRYLANREERTPKQAIGPFNTDAAVYDTAPASGLRVTWFGHSSSLVEIDGLRILIDPVWDERAAPVQWFGPKRFFPPTIALDALPQVDVVLISHDHFDHLGAGTIQQLARSPRFAKTRWVTSLGVGAILSSLGVPPPRWTELNWTEQVELGSVTITALPSRHFSGRSLFNRFETLWSSFAITGPKHRVYYGADSGEWPGFAEIGHQYGPFDLTMLEIGAFDPMWADIHMGPDGAVRSFHALGGKGLLMPIHWGLFDLALHAWRQPIERICSVAQESADVPLWCPRPGLPTDVHAGQPLQTAWWR
jgi:L-ascorbate metabolism protein UlaG (beta-lactamase superfamily)